jgi:PKD repeat protein
MKTRCTFTFFFAISLIALNAQTGTLPSLEWVNSFGGSGSEYGQSLDIDQNGNIITTGWFQGTVDFDPGSGVLELTSNGNSDIYILKTDVAGNPIWAKSIGGTSDDRAYSVTCDYIGNVYVCGYFKEIVDFNPGSGASNRTSNGNADIYILKLDSNGDYIWAKTFGGISFDCAYAIKTDASTNVYISGSYNSTVDFNPGSAVVNYTSNGSADIFISKLNSSGNYVWAKSIGGSSYDKANSLALNTNQVFITGSYGSTVDFNPGSGVNQYTSNGSSDIYVLSLDYYGNYLWAKSIGGSGSDAGESICPSYFGNLSVTGYFSSTVDFNPGTGVSNHTSNGSDDIFILNITSSGNYNWVATLGGNYSDRGTSVHVDMSSNTYITGEIRDTFNVTTSNGIQTIATNGENDIIIAKINSYGNITNHFNIGGPSWDFGSSITIDNNGTIFTTGNYSDTMDFDPDTTTSIHISNGGYDAFLAMYSQGIVANFSASSTNIYLGDTISFTDQSTNTPTNWLWDFGDGVTDSVQNPVHVYQDTGTYSVSLVVSNANGTDSIAFSNYILVNEALAPSPELQFEWAGNFAGNSSTYGKSIATDANGNVYVTGGFYGTVDFDPGTSVYELTSNGQRDIYVSKLSASGDLLWAVSMGNNDNEYGYSLTLHNDNIYVTGYFSGTVDFDPSANVFNLSSNGYIDIFVMKLDAQGNLGWVKNLGGNNTDIGYSIVADTYGSLYITGYFYGTADFNPSNYSTNNLYSNGSSDIFVCKLSSSGNYEWARSIGGLSYDRGYDIEIDGQNNVYITGYYHNTVDFNPGSGIYELTSNGIADGFIVKFTSSGNFVWAKSIGGNDYVYPNAISITPYGEIYLTGRFNSIADFDPSNYVFDLTSIGDDDIFLAKYDNLGGFLWATSAGGFSYDASSSVVVDNSGNAYCMGNFKGTVDFDSGSGVYDIQSNGYDDAFISRFDSTGHLAWVKTIGGTSYDYGNAITLDENNNIYALGHCSGVVDLNPLSGTQYATNTGSTTTFVVKLGQLEIPEANFIASATNVYTNTLIQFTDLTENEPTSWIWDFGDGSSDTTQNPVHVYQNAGSYTVSLIASNNAGSDTFSISNYIIVEEPIGIAQGPELDWMIGMGGATGDWGNSVITDEQGNVYSTGYFTGTVDFDPGVGVYNLSSSGDKDIFILKVDSDGNFVWAKKIGGTDDDYGTQLQFDDLGNIILLGNFIGGVDFDPGPGIYNLNSGGGFIAKYNSTGSFIWAKELGGIGNKFTTDQNGNFITIGRFSGTIDFDPGVGIYQITSSGNDNIFISKLNTVGDFVWAKSYPGNAGGLSLVTDTASSIYITGYYAGTVDFNPGVAVNNLTSNGSYDIFISKITPSGDFQWANGIGASNWDMGEDIVSDKTGNVYVSGWFMEVVDFDPSSGIYNLSSNWNEDKGFIAKYNASGDLIWAKSVGGQSTDCFSLTMDNFGNIYSTGYYYGTSDFDPSSWVYNLNPYGSVDIFILKLNNEGSFIWAKGIGGVGQDWGTDIHVSETGNVFVTGNFGQTINYLNNILGYSSIVSNGGDDAFVLKYSQGQNLAADFVANDTTINIGDTTIFTDLSTDWPTEWYWDFGDGTNDSVQNPVHLYQNPGIYTVSLIASNEFGSDTAIFVNYIDVSVPQVTLDWNVIITGSSHTILIQNTTPVTIDGLSISIGDYIGVFYDSLGLLSCAGYETWTGNNLALTAWGDDGQTPDKDGFASGEDFKWKIFRAVDGVEFEAIAQYIIPPAMPNAGNFVSNGMSGLASLEALTAEIQTINLPLGWSYFSTYIDPFEPNFDSLFSVIVSDVIIAKDSYGLTYWPQWNINTIGNILIGDGYQIKMAIAQSLTVTGIAIVPENTPLIVPMGWSFLGYLRQAPAPIDIMLSPIVSQVSIVKSGLGLTYWPQYNINVIGNMNPGEGYQIKMISQQTLTYPANTAAFSKSEITHNQSEYFGLARNTGNNMTLGIPLSAWETIPFYGDEVAVYSESGLLVGSGVFEGGNMAITLWGNDDLTVEQDGLIEGEQFGIRIWNGKEQTLKVDSWLEGDDSYEVNKIAIAGQISQNSYLRTFQLYQNTPNPFSKSTEFSFYLPTQTEVEFTILNVLGEVVEVLTKEEMTAGKHTMHYETSKLESGTYYYNLKTPNFSDTKKMVIIP